jgi:endoglucanase
VPEAVQMLLDADIADARGFALNLTHYDSTPRQITFGAQIVAGLARNGVRGKHFVINTAENGAPFKFMQYYGTHDRSKRPVPCTATRRTMCATLGIPPTWHVADPRWHLPTWAANSAARLVDGYLWMGRPWLNITPFSLNVPYAMALARSTPF